MEEDVIITEKSNKDTINIDVASSYEIVKMIKNKRKSRKYCKRRGYYK